MSIRNFRVAPDCKSCVNKCCSQPYDWVHLTLSEIDRLAEKTGVPPSEFVVEHRNAANGLLFRILQLPCKFYDAPSGMCTVYDARPLVCRVFPFHPEPVSGHVTLMPAQCGTNLAILPEGAATGWSVPDYDAEIATWVREIWKDAH